MVQTIQKMKLAAGIDPGVTFAIAVRYDLIAGTVNDAGRALIKGGGFVNGQGDGRSDVVPAYLMAAENLDILRRIIRIKLYAEHVTAQGLVPQDAGRGQQGQSFDLRTAQLACRHAGYHAALGMTGQGHAGYAGELLGVGVNLFGICNFVGDGHILKTAFAFAMTVKVKPEGGQTVFLQAVGQAGDDRIVLAGGKAVHQYDQGISVSPVRPLDDGSQLSVVAGDADL